MQARRLLTRFRHLRQLLAFGAVGALATAVQYVVLFVAVQGLHLRPLLGSSVGFVLSAVLNYWLNYHLTFRSRAPQWRAASRFACVALAGLALNGAVMALLTQWLHLHYFLAQLLATAAVFAWTYLVNSRWSFVSPGERTGSPAPLTVVPAYMREECP